MRLVQILVCASVFVYPFITLAEADDTLVRMELRGYDNTRPPDDPLLAIKGFVEFERAQPDISRGIEIFLDILNDGPSTIELLNPIDWLHIQIRNADGVRVELPRVPPEWALCGGPKNTDDPAQLAQLAANRAARDARRPFVAEIGSESYRGMLARPTHTRARRPTSLTLKPTEHFQVLIHVTHIISDAEAYWKERARSREDWERQREEQESGDSGIFKVYSGEPAPQPQTVPIPPGTYKLRISVGLASTDPDGPVSRLLTLPLSDWIIVHLGPK